MYVVLAVSMSTEILSAVVNKALGTTFTPELIARLTKALHTGDLTTLFDALNTGSIPYTHVEQCPHCGNLFVVRKE